ncbi:EamA family transporter RarD [Agromyces sp. NPDC004153]
MSRSARGIAWSLLASTLFGLMFYVSGIIDASPDAVFAWRIVITAACYATMLIGRAQRRAFRELRIVLTGSWWSPLLLLVTSGLVGVQMWLFAWAPAHGFALDASLGYLLLPIVLVLVGRFGFRERVSSLQWIAVGVAGVAVGLNFALTGAVSWVTFAICVGYALYFAVRRKSGLDGSAAFGAEVALLSPLAIWLLFTTDGAGTAVGQLAVIVSGFAGAVAMASYLAASRALSMPVFGMLTYVEPLLLFVAALLLGEQLHGTDVMVYLIIAAALALLAVDAFASARSWTRRRRFADASA